jgi:Tripartite tricarboxylate transporter family receptor
VGQGGEICQSEARITAALARARERAIDEIYTPSISASGCGCCRVAIHGSNGECPILSDANDTLDCPDGARRCARHPRAPDGAMAVGTAWASSRLRQPAGCRHQYRDGYSLVLLGPPAAINATLYDKLNFNVIRDIAPVASIARAPNVIEVSPSVPVKTVPEFIAYAKANPGKLNMASSGVGTSLHVSGELFKMMAGVDLVHVPYRGSVAAITDMLSGQVQVIFDNLPASIEYIKGGNLRALAVTTQYAPTRCRTSRPLVNSYRATRQARGGALVCPRTRLPISSTSRALPIPISEHGSPTWASRSLRRKLRSGPRW